MSQQPASDSPKTNEKPVTANAETPKKMRSMTRKDFGELLRRVITKPAPKAT
jgi:hypothetical protein